MCAKSVWSVPKHYLLLIAGIVWSFAGIMIIATGFPVFRTMVSLVNIVFAAVIFLLFYLLIFSRLVKKHTARITSNHSANMPFWQFFDAPSYIVMVIMMSGGIALRKFHLIPLAVIGPFYTGLGIALFSCGIRFIYVFARENARKMYRI